jgi:hypothetical protein
MATIDQKDGRIFKMTSDQNRKEVLANDKDIARQVPLILTDRTGVIKPKELRNQELFYRAIGR